MRKITSTILVALLTFSIGFGTVAAKPKGDNPGKGKDNGAITVKIRENGTSDRVGDWSCSGVFVRNKNHTRVNAECTISDVGPYAGTYTSETHEVPEWLAGTGTGFIDDASALPGVSEDDLANMRWKVDVTPNGEGGGTVEAVAILD